MRLSRVVIVALLLLYAPRASADDDLHAFVAGSTQTRFDDGPHIGPDARVLRYEYADRWRAAVGGELVLAGVEAPPGALALTLGGLIALDNEDDLAPVPYQLLRAVIGVSLRAATATRSIDAEHRYRLSAELGYSHESDHPSGTSNVASYLQRFVGLDDFSSFEHLRLGVQYEHWYEDRVWFSAGAALRGYTPPLNPGGGREQRVAFELELRLRVHLHGALSAFSAFYTEGIGHELDPVRLGLTTLPALFTVVRGEIGVSLTTETIGRLELYVGVVDEDGRGIDFVLHYGPAFLMGLRGAL